MLVLLELGVLLAEDLDVLQRIQLLLREHLSLMLEVGDLRSIILVLDSCILMIVSDRRNLDLYLFNMLLHVINFLLRLGIGITLPLNFILHHLSLLLSHFVIVESILQPPHLELCVSESAPEAVAFLHHSRPLPLHRIQPPPERLNISGNVLHFITQAVV